MDFLKTIGGKIVGGMVSLGVIVMVIAWWQMDQTTKDHLLTGTGHFFVGLMKVIGWILVVGVLPWVTFFMSGWVNKFENNVASALLIIGYTALEGLMLAWLFGWWVKGATSIVFFSGATLLAGAYNLFACDWIAEKVE
jgi:hypothetical protein